MPSKNEMLARILQVVQNTQKEIHKMATSQAQLDQAIQALGAAVTNEDSLLTQLVAAVQELVTKAQVGGVDLTTEATAINSMASDIATQASNIQTALSAANPPVTPPATPPTA